MTTHTPGPWFVHEIPSHPKPMMSIRTSGMSVCVASGVLDHETEVANARLIAAAPDLLAALELALATIERLHPSTPFDGTQGTRDVAGAAIAKAKEGAS